jgi:hypothetical protein
MGIHLKFPKINAGAKSQDGTNINLHRTNDLLVSSKKLAM